MSTEDYAGALRELGFDEQTAQAFAEDREDVLDYAPVLQYEEEKR